MVNDILPIFENVFSKCVEWTGQLFSATDGSGVLIAAFIIVLVVSLFLVPLRGGNITVSDGITDATRQAMHSPKRWNGKWVKSNGSYKGKFEKRPAGGHRASPR